MIAKPSNEDLFALFDDPFPRLERRRDLTLLRRDENVVMAIPPLNDPLALALFTANLSPQPRLELFIARLRLKGQNRLDGYDLACLAKLIQETKR